MIDHSAPKHPAPASRPSQPLDRDTLPESNEWHDSLFDRDTEPGVDVDMLRAALSAGLR